MDSIVLWLLVGLAVAVLIPYLLGPMLIYFTMRISGDPMLDEVSLDELPRAARKYMLPTIERLEEEGFDLFGVYFLGEHVPNVENFLGFLGKRASRTLVLVVVTYVKQGRERQLKQTHTEFSTETTDGVVIDTNNSEELGAFQAVPYHHIVSLPWVRHVDELYQIHKAAVKHFSAGGTPDWRVGTDPSDYLAESLVEETATQLETGYLYRDAEGDFRPTIKGAILMTYKNLWPITAIRKALRNRRGERLLQELQIELPSLSE